MTTQVDLALRTPGTRVDAALLLVRQAERTIFQDGRLKDPDFTATNHFGEDTLVATTGVVPVS
jgi:hypothetical protein